MTNAELTAFNLGASIELELRRQIANGTSAHALDGHSWTPDQCAARERLGDTLFAFWVFRGALHAVSGS